MSLVLAGGSKYDENMKIRKKGLVVLIFCLAWVGLSSGALVQEEGGSEVIADIKGKTISRTELESAVEGELYEVEMDSLRFAASQRQRRHDILERQLSAMLAEELFELEAQERGIPQAELLEQEIFSKAESPTAQDVEDFYEANQSRMSESKTQMLPTIRRYLAEMKMDEAHKSFLALLKEKYQELQRQVGKG